MTSGWGTREALSWGVLRSPPGSEEHVAAELLLCPVRSALLSRALLFRQDFIAGH